MDQETNDLWVWAIEAAAVQLSLRPNTQPQDGAVFCQLISLEPEEFEDAVSKLEYYTKQTQPNPNREAQSLESFSSFVQLQVESAVELRNKNKSNVPNVSPPRSR